MIHHKPCNLKVNYDHFSLVIIFIITFSKCFVSLQFPQQAPIQGHQLVPDMASNKQENNATSPPEATVQSTDDVTQPLNLLAQPAQPLQQQ